MPKAKTKAKPKATAKKRNPYKELTRKGSMKDRLKENMAADDKAQAKKYGVTVEEYRKAVHRNKPKQWNE